VNLSNVLWVFVLTNLSLEARAEDTSPDDSPSFYDTATVLARPLPSATVSVAVVEAEELRRSGAVSLADVLPSVAGVQLFASGSRAGTSYAQIRGGDPNFTLLLLDGLPLNDWTERQGGGVNLEELPLAFVDRVEVVKGTACSFYGPSALAGVVQIFTRRGEAGPLRAGLRAEAGNASLWTGAGSLAGPWGRGHTFALGATFEREQGRIGDDRFRQANAYGNADLDLGASARLKLNSRFGVGASSDYPDASGGPVYGTGELRQTDRDDLGLGAELELGPEIRHPQRFIVGFTHRSMDRLSPAVGLEVPASSEATTLGRLRLAWQTSLVRSARTSLDVGVSGERESAANESLLLLPPEFGGGVTGDYAQARSTAGAYLELRRELGPLLFEAALRGDVTTGDAPQAAPRLGLLWRSNDGATRLRASAGRASKLPSFFALASPPALGGNPALLPERSISGELGFERSIGQRFEAGMGLFRNDYRDLVDFDFETFTHVNRAKVSARGIEAQARVRPSAAWQLTANVTWLDAEDATGEPLLQRARVVGGASVAWRPMSRLDLRVDLRAVSSLLDRELPVPELERVAGRALLAFTGTWRVVEQWTLRARFENLADRRYETLIGFPGPRRSVRVGLGWQR